MAIETASLTSREAMDTQFGEWARSCGSPVYVLAQFDHLVQFGRMTPAGVDWAQPSEADPSYLFDARVFGPEAEWHVWRDADVFWYRHCSTADGMQQIGARHALWGTTYRPLRDGWILASEDRGFEVALPIERAPGPGEAAFLTLSHIIEPDESGVARIVDSRLTGLAVQGATS